jgi:hypothetical protein
MIWLLHHPLPPLLSARYLSLLVFLCVAGRAHALTGQEERGAWSSINHSILSGCRTCLTGKTTDPCNMTLHGGIPTSLWKYASKSSSRDFSGYEIMQKKGRINPEFSSIYFLSFVLLITKTRFDMHSKFAHLHR